MAKSKVFSRPSQLVLIAVVAVVSVPPVTCASQQPDPSPQTVLRGIDASVAARDSNILSYTVTEHYSLFRNQEMQHPSAEMTVKTTYVKDRGKSYEVLSESGSELLRTQVLKRILENERVATQPSHRGAVVITSANYNMQVKGTEVLDGQSCIRLAVAPKRNSPYLFDGEIWVDAQDDSIVELEGVTSKSATVFAGPSKVTRHYAKIDGFPMATQATATVKSWLLGQTTIKIDYTSYQINKRP